VYVPVLRVTAGLLPRWSGSALSGLEVASDNETDHSNTRLRASGMSIRTKEDLTLQVSSSWVVKRRRVNHGRSPTSPMEPSPIQVSFMDPAFRLNQIHAFKQYLC
jgi:hypothetical protein